VPAMPGLLAVGGHPCGLGMLGIVAGGVVRWLPRARHVAHRGSSPGSEEGAPYRSLKRLPLIHRQGKLEAADGHSYNSERLWRERKDESSWQHRSRSTTLDVGHQAASDLPRLTVSVRGWNSTSRCGWIMSDYGHGY
jgi:hypothetical protein